MSEMEIEYFAVWMLYCLKLWMYTQHLIRITLTSRIHLTKHCDTSFTDGSLHASLSALHMVRQYLLGILQV